MRYPCGSWLAGDEVSEGKIRQLLPPGLHMPLWMIQNNCQVYTSVKRFSSMSLR